MKSFRLAEFFNRGGRVYTGVDLGTHQIKVVRIAPMRAGPAHSVKTVAGRPKSKVEVLGRAAGPTPVDGLANGLNQPEMAAALDQALEAAGVDEGAGGLVAAIGGGRVITRNILMPIMPEKELEAAVRWEAERHIPLPMDELIIRHVSLGEVKENGVLQRRVLLVAVPRDLVLEYGALFREVGRELLAIDLPALALWRVYFGLDSEAASAGVVTVLDIGAAHTELVVICEGQFCYARSLPAGRSLVAGHQSSVETPGSDHRSPATNDHFQAEPAELLREIRRSLDWYQDQNREHPVERIIVSGGGSRADGLVDYLAQNLGLPVEIGGWSATGDQKDRDFDPAFAVAVGLALREVV